MAAVKFFRPGIIKVYVVPTVANKDAVTTAEITAGTDITCSIGEFMGFSYKSDSIEVASWCNTFASSVAGFDKADDSGFTFWENRDTTSPTTANPLRTLLAKGTTTNVVIFPEGFKGTAHATGDLYELWPVQVASTPRKYDQKDAAQWTCNMTITGPPSVDKVLV